MKIAYVDLETTGTDPAKHGIHQIALLIVADGQLAESADFNVRPFEDKEIVQEALDVAGVTKEALERYRSPAIVMPQLQEVLGRHVDKFNRLDKLVFAGYRADFDNQFLRRFWSDCGDRYFGSWFYNGVVDAMSLAMLALGEERASMPDFKLGTVAEYLGIKTDIDGLHDAMYDIKLTREVVKESVKRLGDDSKY